jgi:Xaa-Pro dipeptidase
MDSQLFEQHLATLLERSQEALRETGFAGLVLHSGTPVRYHADDMDVPFRSTPHFARWVPLEGPHHLLCVRPGQRPLLIRVAPEDYWYEQAPLGEPFWLSSFEIQEVASEEEAFKRIKRGGKSLAFVGDNPRAAQAHGFLESEIDPAPLLARLDWERSYKTPYEVACLGEAAATAARGHRAARAAFERGADELEIHQAFVEAAECTEEKLAYPTIVCLDEKAAILHYTGKRSGVRGRVLLIDAGTRHLGYCSDITRTHCASDADPLFADLVDGLDHLQQELCTLVRPALPYPELHATAHVKIGALLQRLGLLKVDGEQAFERGLTAPFFPHGLGHFLGLQVHDVGGHQKDESGGRVPPPGHSPYLRTTRTIEAGMVFTIEPGIYFIEMLLREKRSGPDAAAIDWKLVDRLAPWGGARIEDDLLVTSDGHRNLTRPHL